VANQVMGLVDEVTLMDYENMCNAAPDGGRCSMDKALWLAAPWLSHARWLQKAENRTCLVDTGVSPLLG
jgi:hypothetical protein